jgi:hypothetical protein
MIREDVKQKKRALKSSLDYTDFKIDDRDFSLLPLFF